MKILNKFKMILIFYMNLHLKYVKMKELKYLKINQKMNFFLSPKQKKIPIKYFVFKDIEEIN